MDLRDVQVVDNHCHSVDRQQQHRDVAGWRELFTESPDAAVRRDDVATTVFYRRLLRELAALHGVAPDEQAVLDARAMLDTGALTTRLFADAGVGALVVDTGFPLDGLTPAELSAVSGVRTVALLRLELLFQERIATSTSYAGLREDVRDALSGARDKGWAGFKSIAAYRTGLDIGRPAPDDVEAAYGAARETVARTGAVRLGHKPLLDALLHTAFEVAAAEELPVQVHVGYGDPDADLRAAHPLLLRPVLEHRPYRGMPLVLLHSCWPYVREGAYLAAVYGNAHLDLSYGIPFLSRQELRSATRAALGAAPVSKLMYSSDGARVPELHWIGAHDGRRLLGEVLDELVADGDLGGDDARRAGERVLRDNATALYRIDG